MGDWLIVFVININKEGLFRLINPSASVNKDIAEPISLTQGRCKNSWFTQGYWRMISVKEARKGFFGCYSVCEAMKDSKEG